MKITDVNNYVVFDIETSGLNCKNDEIIQIKALKICSGKNVGKFNAIIKPQKALSVETERFLGISNKKLMKCHPIEEILPIFDEYVGNLPVVGYNLTFCNRFFENNKSLLPNHILATSFDVKVVTEGLFPKVNRIFGDAFSLLYNEKEYGSDLELHFSCFEKIKSIRSLIGDTYIVATVKQINEIIKEPNLNTFFLQKKYGWGYSDARSVVDYLSVCGYTKH